MKELRRIMYWGGWYGSRNIGDRLLLISITDLIQRFYGPHHQIVLSNRPDLVQEYFKPGKGSILTLKRIRSQFIGVLRELSQCDLLIFGGGAPFFDEVNQLIMLSILFSALKFFGKPYLIWCTTCFKLKSRLSGIIIKRIIDGSANTTCRDIYTIDEFRRIGVKNELQIVADPAFTVEETSALDINNLFNKYVFHEDNEKYFALTPRTLRVRDPESITHYRPKSRDEINKQIDVYIFVLDYLVSIGYTPIFIPMNTLTPDDDRKVSKDIINRARFGKYAYLIDEMIPPRAASALYAKCFGSFVSRVHGSVTSALGGCPPIMYAFENKHKGIMESMKMSKFIFDPSVHNFEDIQRMIDELIINKSHITQEIDKNLKKLKVTASKPAQYVKKILGHSDMSN